MTFVFFLFFYMCLIFWIGVFDLSIFFLSFLKMNFIFKIKNIYFHIIFLICVVLQDFFLFYSINLICVSISIIILYKKLILINKFSKCI